MDTTDNPHTPVLLDHCLEIFKDLHIKTFLDGTLGAGGHAEKILTAHPEIEEYIGFDQDENALNLAKKKLLKWGDKVRFIHANFSLLDKFLSDAPIDAALFDIGVSSMQIDQAERGFSFQKSGPLDMRMDQRQKLTADEVINHFSERELNNIFWELGEERRARACAKAIVSERPIHTTDELVKVVLPHLSKKGKTHPATKLFQALRIFVNQELIVIKEVIPKVIPRLIPKGRLAIITFHSLEDRIVKNSFRDLASDKTSTHGLAGLFIPQEPQVKLLTKKGLTASPEEVHSNPRARSAKVRAVEKL